MSVDLGEDHNSWNLVDWLQNQKLKKKLFQITETTLQLSKTATNKIYITYNSKRK